MLRTLTLLHPATSRSTYAALALVLASLAAIAWLTLTPVEPTQPLGHLCILCGDLGGTDFVLNVALFIPLGVGLGMLRLRSRWQWLVPPFLSLAVEVTQWIAIRGRDATLGDLLANSLGGTLGLLVAIYAADLLLPNTRRARRLVALSGALAVAVLAGSGALLKPAVPYLVHWVQWLPKKSGYDVFAGRLDSLQVNGVTLQAFEAVDPIFKPDVAVADRNEVRAVVRPTGRAQMRIALIARLAAPMDEHFMIGRRGDDFVYRMRVRAASAGLRVPIAALPGAFRAEPGRQSDAVPLDGPSAVELEATLQRYGVYLRSRSAAGEKERIVRFSPALAWVYVAPRDVPLGASYEWANALFLGLLTLPTMYWLAISATPRTRPERTRLGRMKSTVMLAIFLAGLASVHIVGGGAAFSPTEWAGVAAAGLIGQVAGPFARRARHARHRVQLSWNAST